MNASEKSKRNKKSTIFSLISSFALHASVFGAFVLLSLAGVAESESVAPLEAMVISTHFVNAGSGSNSEEASAAPEEAQPETPPEPEVVEAPPEPPQPEKVVPIEQPKKEPPKKKTKPVQKKPVQTAKKSDSDATSSGGGKGDGVGTGRGSGTSPDGGTGEGRAQATVTSHLYAMIQKYKKYPNSAKRLGLEGVVDIHVKIEMDGSLTSISTRTSSAHPILVKATEDLIGRVRKNWKCPPLQKSISIVVPVRYTLVNG